MSGASHFLRYASMLLAFFPIQGWAAGENPTPEFKKAKVAYAARQWPEAEAFLFRIWSQKPAPAFAEEAAVLLLDVYIRLDKPDPAGALIQRFKSQFDNSPQLSRIQYGEGLLALKKGLNGAAAQAFASAYLRARIAKLSEAASLALRAIVGVRGLQPEEMESVWKSLAKDAHLGAWMLEQLGNEEELLGRFQSAEAAYSGYLTRYPQSENLSRVQGRLDRLKSIPREQRSVLLMAPFSGDFADVGRSLREGVSLAFEEAKARGETLPNVKILDDQGNMVRGVRQLRQTLQEGRVDAILGPAMSDVAAGVAIELSAGKSPIPLITPTATTHGIASLGDGVFQLNVTTQVLGQRIAGFASDCLKLKDFAIVAPHSEYGFQLAEAFAETLRKKGGTVSGVAYVDPDASDLSEPLQELRQKLASLYFAKKNSQGRELPDGKQMRSYASDSTFPIDGIFIPAASGDEADKLASQVIFNKIRGQMLGSSGWYDKSLLLKSSEATEGAYFSVDFQDQPKTETYATFSRAYKARWKHAPDRAAALSYDAARFLLQGLRTSSQPGTLIPALHAIPVFFGVLGNIDFGSEGVNQNTALFQLEHRSFKEVEDCASN